MAERRRYNEEFKCDALLLFETSGKEGAEMVGRVGEYATLWRCLDSAPFERFWVRLKSNVPPPLRHSALEFISAE